MVMSWIFTGMAAVSLICALITGNGSALGGAVLEGAQKGIDLVIALAGSLCLWSGVGKLMEAVGLTDSLARLLMPVLGRIFPSAREDKALGKDLCANVCANLLGLGNAATPMGISAAKRLKRGQEATDELCRLIVLNTASIQLIPTTVAAVRASLGSSAPFGILPAVWVSSLCSAGLGLTAAGLLGRLRR